MSTMVNISGLNKAEVLAALFNASRQLGLGFLDTSGAVDMTIEDARQVINAKGLYYDYLRGRIMKVDISGDEFSPSLYDRDNGIGAAAQVIESIRKSLKPTYEMIDR